MAEVAPQLLSGNEAIALAALDAGITLGVGYPGTPSTEILENLSRIGGEAQWAPNEKVALEVGIGVAYAGGRALVTMKHVGVNVAADPLFTVAYTGVSGALVVISADDPGMHSSQNEQDNRRYAVAAGVPMLEPSDSQEAYDFMLQAFELSESFNITVLFRLTTRVCHSKSIVRSRPKPLRQAHYERDIKGRVMIPGYARPAHRHMREKLKQIAASPLMDKLTVETGNPESNRGIITSGITYQHVVESLPDARILKLGITYPLPLERVRAFVDSVDECMVIEEGDPCLEEAFKLANIPVEGKPEEFRFGELTVDRVQQIITRNYREVPPPPPGKPPQLCARCPHRIAFSILSRLDCIVAGDIGCYTLGVMPPFEAMDTCVCMGASIGVGLGLRHALPTEQARRVVSVIGDSTFAHTGINGLVEMAYNPPTTGHVVLILDNLTTAMTGTQEHPGTGRRLDHSATQQLDFEALSRAIGIQRVHTIDPTEDAEAYEQLIKDSLDSGELVVIIARKPCILIEKRIARLEAEECLLEQPND